MLCYTYGLISGKIPNGETLLSEEAGGCQRTAASFHFDEKAFPGE